jgi:hypothetical protein
MSMWSPGYVRIRQAAPPNGKQRLRCWTAGRVAAASRSAPTSLSLLSACRRRAAEGAYDVQQFVEDLRERTVTPHIANDGHLSKTGKPRATAMDRRTTRHPGYAISQCCRKRIEEVFGWIKGSARLAKVKLRGQAKVDAVFTLALAAYNLVRLPKLLGAPA